MWSTIMAERFGAKDPKSLMLRFHTQTGGATLTAQQPRNNIVRTALEALAAVLGGTQSLHTNSFDEALALPTEQAAKIALRTQQVIGQETGVTHTVDPLGGSYYVESLTNEVEARAGATSTASTGWAAPSRRSRRGSTRTRSRRPPSRSNGGSSRGSAWWSE
jgi:methylmalonyl-CoA mutase N-terminal domain/subunit